MCPNKALSKSTGNENIRKLTNSVPSPPSVNALNSPGTPSRSSTCDFLDNSFLVSFGFGHISVKNKNINLSGPHHYRSNKIKWILKATHLLQPYHISLKPLNRTYPNNCNTRNINGINIVHTPYNMYNFSYRICTIVLAYIWIQLRRRPSRCRNRRSWQRVPPTLTPRLTSGIYFVLSLQILFLCNWVWTEIRWVVIV